MHIILIGEVTCPSCNRSSTSWTERNKSELTVGHSFKLKNLKNIINYLFYFYRKLRKENYPNMFFTKVIKQICFKSFLRGLLAKLSLEGEETLLIVLTLKGKACLPIQTFYLFYPKKMGGILSLFSL